MHVKASNRAAISRSKTKAMLLCTGYCTHSTIAKHAKCSRTDSVRCCVKWAMQTGPVICVIFGKYRRLGISVRGRICVVDMIITT
jgi:hypothetical protein